MAAEAIGGRAAQTSGSQPWLLLEIKTLRLGFTSHQLLQSLWWHVLNWEVLKDPYVVPIGSLTDLNDLTDPTLTEHLKF